MDLATIFGLLVSFALLALAIALGGSFVAFMNVPSLMIVIGGTFAITLVCFSFSEVMRAQNIMVRAIFNRIVDPGEAAYAAMELAEQARKNGVLELQKFVAGMENSPFLQKAILLVVDGTPGDEVERILDREVSAMTARHAKSASVLRKAAEISPAMGLIGTLVGLVQMLSNLNDPSNIGPAMAVALLTTFYGAILATMVFAPLASKLERNSEEEALLNHVYTMAAASISRRENPRRLEMLLNTVLPTAKRLQYFD